MNKILSKEQLKVYNAIKNFIEENGYSPTIRELCNKTGKRSTQTISAHLFRLKKYGYIDYIKGARRTIKIVNNNDIKSIQDLNSCIFGAKPIDVIKTELKEKDKEIERLNNIIDELEECLKYWLKLSEENKNMSNYTIYRNVLDILKELKEDDDNE